MVKVLVEKLKLGFGKRKNNNFFASTKFNFSPKINSPTQFKDKPNMINKK